MKQAASIKGLQLEGVLPRVKINTSATDFAPIQQLQFMKFKAVRWVLFGDVVSVEVGGYCYISEVRQLEHRKVYRDIRADIGDPLS